MANGQPNWWDPAQHWQLAELENTARTEHQRLENLCLQRFAALEQRVAELGARARRTELSTLVFHYKTPEKPQPCANDTCGI